jgi:NAD(P)H-hydrate epimerase
MMSQAANIPYYTGPLPALTTSQMIEVDRAMIEDYQIGLLQMMENAGRSLAHLARQRFLGGDPRGQAVVILAGTGGNGGGALVCARRLHNCGADVRVFTTKADEAFAPVPGHQLAILQSMGVPVSSAGNVEVAMAVFAIDDLIGYSLQSVPRGTVADLIGWARRLQMTEIVGPCPAP